MCILNTLILTHFKQVLGKYHIHHCYVVYLEKLCFTSHKILNLSACMWRDWVRVDEIQCNLVKAQ